MNSLDLYETVRPLMDVGDTLQFSAPWYSPIGTMIKLRTDSIWSHTASIIKFPEYGDHLFTFEALAHGDHPYRLSTRLANYNGQVWWMPLKSKWNNYRNAIGTQLMSHLGKPYDKLTLLKMAVGKVSLDARRLICSELDFISKQEADLPPLTGIKRVPSPGDYSRWSVFKLIYENTLRIL